MIAAGMEEHEAWEKSTGIVIHGDELARRNLAEDNLDDLDPEKGRFIQNWISKKEVVFARTSPS
jgi:sodium/potassium-transporting ATPase subunit alpha